MAKFYGEIGYGESVEKAPGVWADDIIEKLYFGDVIRNTRKLVDGVDVNSDLAVNASISVVADAYANEHFFAIRYIRWMGSLWLVADVTPEPPRLILRLGGIYNGPVAPAAPVTP